MTLEDKLNLENEVEAVLAEMRPMIQRHAGDVRLVDIRSSVVVLELVGACAHCALASDTLNDGLKEAIMLRCPEVTDVVATNLPDHNRTDLTGPADWPISA